MITSRKTYEWFRIEMDLFEKNFIANNFSVFYFPYKCLCKSKHLKYRFIYVFFFYFEYVFYGFRKYHIVRCEQLVRILSSIIWINRFFHISHYQKKVKICSSNWNISTINLYFLTDECVDLLMVQQNVRCLIFHIKLPFNGF